jgi:hypothetical protein
MWIYYRFPTFQLIQQIQIRDRLELEWIREQLQQIRDRELPEHISSLGVFYELLEFAELDGIRALSDRALRIIDHSEDLGVALIAEELLNHPVFRNLN